ncbi:MAG: MBL fold metallo-hydrolase, partial [Oscillospiraceae bacterium]|nr:MBL fold metallo-hydrolase [Oscillospiraceae bacterium]
MVTKIALGLYAIAVPLPNNPLKNLNAYVVTGSRNLLIDTGFHQKECRDALLSGLQELGISMEHTDIFLTHLHSDHTGLAPEIRGKDTKIFIGEKDLSHMPGPHSTFRWADSDDRFAAEGFPRDLLAILTEQNPAQGLSPIPYDGYLPVKPGDVFSYGEHRFTAVHTPGHTPGHMCLWEAETGICLLGDHVLFDITPNITRWMGVSDSLGDYLQALRDIQTLPVTVPLPAHRQVHMDFQARCQQLIAHHGTRCQEV